MTTDDSDSRSSLTNVIQIGASNLPDQMLDFSGCGSWDFVSAGHIGRSYSWGVINNQIGLHLPGL